MFPPGSSHVNFLPQQWSGRRLWKSAHHLGFVIRDYACRDFYELVLGYYKPRVTLYIQELRERMRLGQRLLYNSQDLDAKYDALEKRWVKEGFPLLDTPAKPEHLMERVEELLRTYAPGLRT